MSNTANPFTSSQLYQKISTPTLNILDALAGITRETSWDLSAVVGSQLGTLSAARFPSKPFIVGFIPPDVVVNFVPITSNQSTLTTLATAATTTVAGPSVQAPQRLLQQLAHAQGHSAQFYQQLQSVANSIGANPADMLAVMLNESGTNPQQQSFAKGPNGQPVAVGLIQFTQASAQGLGTSQQALLGMTDVQQLPYVQKYYSNCNYGGTYPSTGSLYLATFAPAFLKNGNDPNTVIFSQASSGGANGAYTVNSGLDHGNKGYITVGDMSIQMDLVKQTGAYQELVQAYNSATNSNIAYQTPAPDLPAPGTIPASVTNVMTNSINITDANAEDPLSDQLGRNISIAYGQRVEDVQKQTNYLNQQILAIQAMPALMMLVNPSEFNRSYEHTTDPVKTRSGFVVNMWLEKPLVISSKGVTAGQYVFQSDGGGGISALNRIYSVSYQNLMSLVSMFKNNANIFTDGTFGDGNTGIPLISMSLYIYYDNHIYIGSFDDFTITDDGNKPYNLTYDWKFTVRYDIDTTGISDNFITGNGLTIGTSAARDGF
jgi:hypothetical protein